MTRVPGRVPRGGVDDEAGRLVDREELVVLVQDREGDVLGLELGLPRLRHLDRDLFAGVDDMRAPGRRAADVDGPLGDQLLDAGSGEIGAGRHEEEVEPCAGGRGADPEPPDHRPYASARLRRER